MHALASSEAHQADKYQLKALEVTSKTGITPRAHILINIDGKDATAAEYGSGPVDAVFKAIEVLVKSHAQLELYQVNAITSGTDSQGEVLVRLNKDGRIVTGQGADTDIVIASAKAYLNALNWLSVAAKPNPQTDEQNDD